MRIGLQDMRSVAACLQTARLGDWPHLISAFSEVRPQVNSGGKNCKQLTWEPAHGRARHVARPAGLTTAVVLPTAVIPGRLNNCNGGCGNVWCAPWYPTHVTRANSHNTRGLNSDREAQEHGPESHKVAVHGMVNGASVTMSSLVSKKVAQSLAKSEAKSSKGVTPCLRLDPSPDFTLSARVRKAGLATGHFIF
jgi:hypothetical protein